MKRLISIFLCLMLAFVTTAQTLSITNFVELNDLDARAYEPILDQNGKKCAILKIVTTAQGFTFDVGALGVRKTVQKTAEIWVYVPEGTRKIKIAHPQLGQLGTEDGYYWFPQAVREATCYRLTLVSGKTKIIVEEEEIPMGLLVITTEPTGADLYITTPSGIEDYAGRTPYQQLVAHGTYYFRVSKKLYHEDHGKAEVYSDKVTFPLRLIPNFGTLQLTSEPSGARVMLESTDKEYTTPCTIEQLPSGTHTIRLLMDRYSTATQEVTIRDNETTTLNISMQARYASVTITTLEGATIFINGQEVGTSLHTAQLTEGTYNIEARLTSHTAAKKQVKVVANQPQAVEILPTPIYGGLVVKTEPLEANVTIDGQSYGESPIFIKKMLIGEHSLTLTKAGCESITKTFVIEKGQTLEINETLHQGGNIAEHEQQDNNDTELEKLLRQSANKDMTCVANGVRFEMVHVRGGEFVMGATKEQGVNFYEDEKPTHSVTLSSFYIGKYEVTQELWTAVMGSNPSEFTSSLQNPVERVSWNDCQTFIKKLNDICHKNGSLPLEKNFYLPTEAQWEYAARGGNKSRGYIFSGSNTLGYVAWFKDNANETTHPVGSKAPNELGIYDMSGNVYEWCSDWKGDYSSAAQTNPVGASSGTYKVYRGGSYHYASKNNRLSYRGRNAPDARYSIIGLRLAVH